MSFCSLVKNTDSLKLNLRRYGLYRRFLGTGKKMLIKRLSPNKYEIDITNGEAGQLTKLAIFYASCDCSSMLRTIIQDGIDLNQSILKLHEDTGYRQACEKKQRILSGVFTVKAKRE